MRAILLACAITDALAFGYFILIRPQDPFEMWRLNAAVSVIFVGGPAFLGITCLMLPLHDALIEHGARTAALGVICANVILVTAVWFFALGSMELSLALCAGFAVIAAGIWLIADRFFGRNLRA